MRSWLRRKYKPELRKGKDGEGGKGEGRLERGPICTQAMVRRVD
jgi:hypothetical protein